MPSQDQPRHVTVLARLASVVWVAFFMTIAFGAHWGRDSVVLLVATIVATAIALGAQVRSTRRRAAATALDDGPVESDSN